jgi:hypothetical protein
MPDTALSRFTVTVRRETSPIKSGSDSIADEEAGDRPVGIETETAADLGWGSAKGGHAFHLAVASTPSSPG